MKLYDILLELKDPLVHRFDSYGAWIHPGGKIYPVKGRNGHAAFLAQNLDLLEFSPKLSATFIRSRPFPVIPRRSTKTAIAFVQSVSCSAFLTPSSRLANAKFLSLYFLSISKSH